MPRFWKRLKFAWFAFWAVFKTGICPYSVQWGYWERLLDQRGEDPEVWERRKKLRDLNRVYNKPNRARRRRREI